IATRRLRLDERAEHLGPPILKVDFPLQSALQQSLDPLLRFRPRQRGLKGGDGVEEPVGGRQRDLVDEILRGGDGTPVEGGDPARECVDEAVQLASGSARLTYPYRSAVSPSKSFAPRTISSGRPRPTRCGRRSVPPPPGCTPTPTSGCRVACSRATR